MTEKTSSSPSLKHIGTYKAAAQHRLNSKIQAQLTSIPYEIGMPLPRSQQCINVSLEKKGKGKTTEYHIAPGENKVIIIYLKLIYKN